MSCTHRAIAIETAVAASVAIQRFCWGNVRQQLVQRRGVLGDQSHAVRLLQDVRLLLERRSAATHLR